MANLGYVQVTRRCNQLCRFCSNPPSGRDIGLEDACRRIDDLAARGYEGVILTGGEPTIVPWLPAAIRHAASRRVEIRIITNGQLLAGGELLAELVAAGLRHLHVSLYSHDAAVHDALTCNPGSHERALRCLERATERPELAVDVNCVIHRYNADALDAIVELLVGRFPRVRHLVFNNLDARMNRVAENPDTVPRLSDLERSLHRALRLASDRGLSFRVERVPLCYMAEWAHCSTETRKIVKAEERAVHFLDEKGLVQQRDRAFVHGKADVCGCCRVSAICAGLDGVGEFRDGSELYPVFVDPDDIARRVRSEP